MQGPMETAQDIERKLAQLRSLVAERKLDRVEDVWMEAMEDPEGVGQRIEAFLDVAESFLDQIKDKERAAALLELLLPTFDEASHGRSALRLYWLLVKAVPERKDYRAGLAERFERHYPLASPERAFYEASGYTGSSDPLAALGRLDRLLRFKQGAYVYHRSGWGVGKVLTVDPFLKQVKVDLEHKKDHRIAIDAVDSILEPLDPGHFKALRHDRLEELRRMRDETPVHLISIVLESQGNPLPLKEIKAQLVPDIIEMGAWTKWWNRVKALLREAGIFRVGDRAPYAVEKLQAAVSYEDELIRRFQRAEWPDARQLARQVARRGQGELSAAWDRIREKLLLVCDQNDVTKSIEAALILERGDAGSDGEIFRKVFGRHAPRVLAAALQDLTGADDPRRAVESLPAARPEDWTTITELLVHGKKDALRDAAWEILCSRAPEKAKALLQDIVKSPKTSPEAFCFLITAQKDEAANPVLEALRSRGARDVLVLVMDLLDHLQHRGQREGRIALKDAVGRVQTILTGSDCAVFREGLAAMETPERLEIHARLVKNDNLLPQAKGALLDALMDVEPEAAMAREKPVWEEDAIYVTAAGLSRKKEEFRELMEEKLPKNFQDIGRAAAFGDLSENAEYTSALEERDHLTKRAAKMKDELDKVKIIDPELVKKGVAGLGSRIRLRNLDSGEEVVYSVLGPWDGGPEDGVISYLSPLGRIFLGKSEGDTVEVKLPASTERYQLLEARSFFEND